MKAIRKISSRACVWHTGGNQEKKHVIEMGGGSSSEVKVNKPDLASDSQLKREGKGEKRRGKIEPLPRKKNGSSRVELGTSRVRCQAGRREDAPCRGCVSRTSPPSTSRGGEAPKESERHPKRVPPTNGQPRGTRGTYISWRVPPSVVVVGWRSAARSGVGLRRYSPRSSRSSVTICSPYAIAQTVEQTIAPPTIPVIDEKTRT